MFGFFLLLVILAGPHFEMSHFLIIMNLFRFMLALAHSKFPQNFSSHCGTMTWANDMQWCDNDRIKNDDDDDDYDCLMMIMILAPCCVRCFCFFLIL